jgi:hypothetical protein
MLSMLMKSAIMSLVWSMSLIRTTPAGGWGSESRCWGASTDSMNVILRPKKEPDYS